MTETMKRKIEIVEELQANGYHLFNETPENFINRTGVSIEDLTAWLENLKKYKGKD